VQVFYLISGFYMALVMPKYRDVMPFYVSRALRIFSVYWSVLFAIVAISVVLGLFFGNWATLQPYIDYSKSDNGFVGMLLVCLSNVTLFFQDWSFYFTDIQGEGLRGATDFWKTDFPLYRYLIIPQSWSVAIELCFYLCAPFACRFRTRSLILLVLLLFCGRFVFYWRLGLNHDPWTYRFFPFEFSIFLLGILTYRFYRLKLVVTSLERITQRYSGLKGIVVYWAIVGGGLVVVELLAPLIERCVGLLLSPLVIILFFIAILPISFEVSKRRIGDRILGEFSYPIYLIHFFVLYSVATYRKSIPGLSAFSPESLTLLCMVISLLLSIPIIHYVAAPVDSIRRRLLK
jgi:peptidoglycan/LPS O-acetylase OafA/YrhL